MWVFSWPLASLSYPLMSSTVLASCIYCMVILCLCKLEISDEYFFCVVQLIQQGKGDAIRIRAILRSLIPIQDLEGVISISFQMPSVSKGQRVRFISKFNLY